MSSDNILVAIKSRPFIQREKSEKLRPQWSIQDKAIFQIDEEGYRLGEPYSFDHIFTECITNANVYSAIVEPLVKSFLNGFNSTIFAYGQTSSGKTHTMMGTDATLGIIQMAINDVFQHVVHDTQRRYLISCSYFEIYNEKINDLLDKNGQDLKIREDFCGNTFVNAKEEVVTQQSQVFELMKVGNKIRKIGCTNMNERSSRSHTIFRFTIKSTQNEIEHGPVQISQLNLVDLAGSERIAHTKAAGVRLKEGVNINKSLLALGNVIRQLSEGEGFINYRDSNLTRLLQHALGGNAKSLIIATITIAAGEETKSTLEFAQRAKVIKNKPIINEILSEQDKLKQYELVTASYKGRLEKEKQRIQEMEQEKQEREREILKLKQQVKLIDLFTNGPKVSKHESRIPRRHTVGHYASRISLQTIPEARELSSNGVHEKHFENGSKHEFDDEELFLKTTSDVSDYDYMKMVIEESLDEGILAVTPEPPEDLPVQEEGTPTSCLRERLKYLEESYMSLKEFTKLESECKEDKSLIYELVKEKDNLLKDLIDLNAIVKETRQEKEQIKVKFEDELCFLKSDVDYLRKKGDEYAFALEQAEAEKDALRLAKEQLLNDNECLLEQQKLKYEKQLQYLTNEVEQLNKHYKANKEMVDYNFEEEIKKLREENDNFKIKVEKITGYEEKIVELEEKLQTFEKEEERDVDILSVSMQTEAEEITSDMKEALQTDLRNTIIEKECTDLKENIEKLNDKLRHIQYLNLALEEELQTCKQKSFSFLEIENSNSNMRKEIAQKEEEINTLIAKVRSLENDNQNYKTEITIQKEEAESRVINNSELSTKVETLQKDVQSKEEQIKVLLNQIVTLEEQNQKVEINLQMEEVQSKNEDILFLKDKIGHLEKSNQDYEDRILICNEQIQSKDDKISELANKIQNLEADHRSYMAEINSYKKEMDTKASKIISQADRITQIESDIHKYEEDIIFREKELESKATKIIALEEVLTNLEIIIKDYKKDVDFYKDKLQSKDIEISDLSDKYNSLQNNSEVYEVKISQYKRQLESREQKITVLTDEIEKLEQEGENNKQKMATWEEKSQNQEMKIMGLEERIITLETENNDYKEQIAAFKKEAPFKDNQILNLKSKLDAIQIEQSNNVADIVAYKQDVESRDSHIAVLKNKIGNLEKDNDKYKQEIDIYIEDVHSKEKIITTLTEKVVHLEKVNEKHGEETPDKEDLVNKIEHLKQENKILEEINVNLKEEIEVKNQAMSELNTTITNLEKTNSHSQNEIQFRDEKISNLTDEIKNLENEYHHTKDVLVMYQNKIKLNETTVLELINKIDKIEMDNNNMKLKADTFRDEIQNKDVQILELTNKIKDLENNIDRDKEEVQIRDMQIIELTNKIKDFEDLNHSNMEQILIRDNKITELTNEVNGLEECNNTNKEEILIRDNQIMGLTDIIDDLESRNNGYKRQVMIRDNRIMQLTNEIKELDESNISNKEQLLLRDNEVMELTNKIKDLEKDNCNNKEQVVIRDKQILELTNMIQDLQRGQNSKNEEIFGLSNRIQNLEDEIIRLNTDIESKSETILKLTNKVSKLDNDCHNYEDEISQCKEEILLQERKIKDLIESSVDKSIQHKTVEDYNKEDDIRDLNKRITSLLSEKEDMQKKIDDMLYQKEYERRKHSELENRVRSLHLENVTLSTRIFDLENLVVELKSSAGQFPEKLEKRNIQLSASSSSVDLSPREARRRKRQSIHDQRRGIDLAAGDIDEAAEEQSTSTKDLKDLIEKLKAQNELLTNENNSLEFEVQGFIRELDDYKKYNEDQDIEIKMLKEKIEKVKKETGHEDCKECPQKLHHIKKLEELQKQNKFKIVDLQTKIYDLQNTLKVEKSNTEEKEKRMHFHIKMLETRLGDIPLPEMKNAEIQCDLMNYQQLQEKYSNMKKLARMRREEGNLLRARLGMNPDEPVT